MQNQGGIFVFLGGGRWLTTSKTQNLKHMKNNKIRSSMPQVYFLNFFGWIFELLMNLFNLKYFLLGKKLLHFSQNKRLVWHERMLHYLSATDIKSKTTQEKTIKHFVTFCCFFIFLRQLISLKEKWKANSQF